MSYPEEASTAEMVNYTVQALWSYEYMKFYFRFLYYSRGYQHPLPAPLALKVLKVLDKY